MLKGLAMKVSNFLVPAGSSGAKELVNESGILVADIIPYDDYYRLASFDPDVAKKRHSDLLAFSKELHELIWTKAKISEEDKPLLVSGTLIALMNATFMKTFSALPAEEVQEAWLGAIKKELDKADIPQAKKDTMLQPYSTIAVHPNLGKPDSRTAKEYPDGVFKEIITSICDNVWPYINVYHDFDVVGQFYGEFLKYTAGDKKALGIVLTPRHVAELFSLIANVGPESKVLDICAGTGGFLISAMQHMLKKAVTEEERTDIKKNRLVGIENNPKMFALAASNMILRGDGKANLHQASCFDDAVIKAVRKMKPNVGMLNPPYAQSKSNAELHELYFVKQMLDCLEQGSMGIAIVPMSCAIAPNPVRDELMKHHTLDAVMSMPQELFYPVGTVTCIMVWIAGKPHAKSARKTWFGYWRDDGFIKTKHKGRIDQNGLWPDIRDRWVEMYRNREVHAGESVMQVVTAADEWCAEAYMETDYSVLTQAEFEKVVQNMPCSSSSDRRTTRCKRRLQVPKINDLFILDYGHSLELNRLEQSTAPGAVNFVGRAARNNGVTARVKPIPGVAPTPAGTITVALNGQGGAGVAFLQPFPFYSGFHVMVLTPKKPMTEQEKLWWVMCITANKFRFGFGRQANRTLKDLNLPSLNNMPAWVKTTDTDCYKGAELPASEATIGLRDTANWKPITLQDLFDIRKGQRLTKANMLPGDTPYVGASDAANGVTAFIGQAPIHKGGTISVSYNGSVAEAFYQPEPYWATDDVNVLYPKGYPFNYATHGVSLLSGVSYRPSPALEESAGEGTSEKDRSFFYAVAPKAAAAWRVGANIG
jgi:type I restriction enzyme M protein